MKKLNKQITASFYKDPEGYVGLQEHWSRLMQDKTHRKSLRTAHHLLYLILRGKNWQRAFAPVTNPVQARKRRFLPVGSAEGIAGAPRRWIGGTPVGTVRTLPASECAPDRSGTGPAVGMERRSAEAGALLWLILRTRKRSMYASAPTSRLRIRWFRSDMPVWRGVFGSGACRRH